MNNNNTLSNRFMKWKIFAALAGLLLVRTAMATDATWPPPDQVGASFDYTIPGNPPPNIDALAFDNENRFTVSFFQYSPSVAYYETLNTLFYTNNGTMIANASILTTIDGLFFLGNTYGSGFQFDHQTTNTISRDMADTFYNPGTIRCNSFIDGNNIFEFGNTTYFFVASIGE